MHFNAIVTFYVLIHCAQDKMFSHQKTYKKYYSGFFDACDYRNTHVSFAFLVCAAIFVLLGLIEISRIIIEKKRMYDLVKQIWIYMRICMIEGQHIIFGFHNDLLNSCDSVVD